MAHYIGPAPVLDCPALLAGLAADPHAATRPWAGPHASALLTRSAVSLALIGRRHGGLWLPGLFCNASLALCRKWGIPVNFYPVRPDLSPDWDWCRVNVFSRAPAAFVVVHTFGRAMDCTFGRAMADAAGWVLVEDAAHVLAPVAAIGQYGDYVMYSPHKLLPLPHGAILVARDGDGVLEAVAALPKAALGQAGLIWLGKRVVQRLTPWSPSWRRSLAGTVHADDPEDGGEAPVPLQANPLVMRLLAALGPRLSQRLASRRAQVAAIAAALAMDSRWEVLTDLAAPYRAVVRAADATIAADLFRLWRQSGIAAESWPDLPPEVTAAAALHAEALDWRRRAVLLPLPANWSARALALRMAKVVMPVAL